MDLIPGLGTPYAAEEWPKKPQTNKQNQKPQQQKTIASWILVESIQIEMANLKMIETAPWKQGFPC